MSMSATNAICDHYRYNVSKRIVFLKNIYFSRKFTFFLDYNNFEECVRRTNFLEEFKSLSSRIFAFILFVGLIILVFDGRGTFWPFSEYLKETTKFAHWSKSHYKVKFSFFHGSVFCIFKNKSKNLYKHKLWLQNFHILCEIFLYKSSSGNFKDFFLIFCD